MFGGCIEPFECNCSLGKNYTMQNKYKGAHCDIRKVSILIPKVCLSNFHP